ncbi:hypothetical protein Enr13x_23230 [Stieleria neptunia]|uniref:Uncharacterized protein n=1 Tax=Stieleria neptunia TaxID=2527979 RepID=A0A518HNQ0_9BACT|nr:hypothetical protein [Stieleria neptunia]QDV42476.1 hypothetical protein Enr13x_23230 [Stieleria neptunia]
MAKNKNTRKAQLKRERKRRAAAKKKREKARARFQANQDLAVDPAHSFSSLSGEFDFGQSAVSPDVDADADADKNPEIAKWFDRYSAAKGNQRIEMVRAASEEDLDQEWREALFPETVYEAETGADPAQYVDLLEHLAESHRELYRQGLLWFLRSRITHYLSIDDTTSAETAVAQDADEMTETGEAFYGTVTMLRLANLEAAAESLVLAGYRCMDATQLMPWAVEKILHVIFIKHLRECIQAGVNDESIRMMETALQEFDLSQDKEFVTVRREIVGCVSGQSTRDWTEKQLSGDTQKSIRNRMLLAYEFAGWLNTQQSIALSPADVLSDLVLETFSREKLVMRDYFRGVPKTEFEAHLASMLGFMSLDRFKAPATLIAVEYFGDFLFDRNLIDAKSLAKTKSTVEALERQMKRVLKDEWSSFRFLDSLRPTEA